MSEEKQCDKCGTEGCSHDCSSCSSKGQTQDFHIDPSPRSHIKKMIGIVSGKGGVGKSFVTATLASAMSKKGYRVGVLDGDITGPSMAKVFGVTEKAMGDGELILPAITSTGIQLISTNMLLDSDDQPIIWRGPMVAGILKQFYQEVYWDEVDYMFVDMPPGTSDVPLTAFQSLPLDGIIVVTSPQDLVSMVVEKAINMAKMMNVNILGLVENMSYVECSNCNHKIYVFGESHTGVIAEKYNLPVLAQIPLREGQANLADTGKVEEIEVPELETVVNTIESL